MSEQASPERIANEEQLTEAESVAKTANLPKEERAPSRRLSYADLLRQKLSQRTIKSPDDQYLFLLAVCVALGRFQGRDFFLRSRSKPFLELCKDFFEHHCGFEAELRASGQQYRLFLPQGQAVRSWKNELSSLMGYDIYGRQPIPFEEKGYTVEERRLMLRAFFLSTARMRDPKKKICVEFSFRQQNVAQFFQRMLLAEDIDISVFKDGKSQYRLELHKREQLTHFLIAIGAHASVTDLESIWVEKQVNKSVNRVLNCDQANVNRILESAAKDLQAVQYLQAKGLLEQMDSKYRDLAQYRMEHPEASLQDLQEAFALPKTTVHRYCRRLREEAKRHQLWEDEQRTKEAQL